MCSSPHKFSDHIITLTGQTVAVAITLSLAIYLLQLVANGAVQLLVLDLCMTYGFTTIVITALMDAKGEEGSDELKINSREASWLGNGCHELEGSTVTIW